MNLGMTEHPRQKKYRESAKHIIEESFGVYILRCRSRDPEFVDDYAKDKLGEVPDWAGEAAEYQTIYYLGSSKNLMPRIGSHFYEQADDFTTLFSPETLMEIRLCSAEEIARNAEETIAESYRQQETRYCYSDGYRGGN